MEQFFSFQCLHRGLTRTCGSRVNACDNTGSAFSPVNVYVGCKSRFLVLSSDNIIEFSKLKGPIKHGGNRVFAVSKVDNSSLNGGLQHSGRIPHGNLNGIESISNGFNTCRNFESNIHLRRLVRNGELEEAFKFLDRMTYHGDIPDVIACTSLIRGFRKICRTKKATRLMEILEESGGVLDVITYNVLVSGFCKSGEIDKALQVLDRLSVAPDVVGYNTISRSLSNTRFRGLCGELVSSDVL